MMPIRFSLATAATLCTALFLCSCSNPQRLSGATSETTNGFTAVVQYSNGNAVERGFVCMRTKNFLTDTANYKSHNRSNYNTWTDSAGKFTIDSIDTGEYAIYAQDGAGNSAIINGKAQRDSLVDLGILTIKSSGAISGIVDISMMAESTNVYARIFGMDRLIRADYTTGRFLIPSVPEGEFAINLISSSMDYAAKDIPKIKVKAGCITDIGTIVVFPYSGWTGVRRYILNTSSSGAGVDTMVKNFPVLIRLNRSNFNFSEAMTDGMDIRFAKKDSIPLPFEIERWDANAGNAEIWVKVDTVFGNNSQQFITMYWSNPNAQSLSCGRKVFDTSSGLQAVWHLGQPATGITLDATANCFSGKPSDSGLSSNCYGAIGGCMNFDGKAGYITFDGTEQGKLNFSDTSEYSISAWVYTDTLDTNQHSIVNKGLYQYGLQMFKDTWWDFYQIVSNVGWIGSRSPATAKTWQFVAGIHNGKNQYLYVDGQLKAEITDTSSYVKTRNETYAVTIGKLSDGNRYFKGNIDEVRLSNISLSPAWIRLCYMNQRTDDKLVMLK